MYTHIHICFTKFSNMQGCWPFLSPENNSPKIMEHDPQSQQGEALNSVAAAVNHVISQWWCESSKNSPGSTDQELAVFPQRF